MTNNTLPKRLNDFLNYLKIMKGRSVNTIDGYKIDLKMMFKFLKNSEDISDIDDNFIKNISFSDLCDFVKFLDEKGSTATTKNRKISSIKSFYDYLVKIKLISSQDNIAIDLDMSDIGKREPIHLTINESKKLLKSIKWDTNCKRDYCIITLFLHCGLRNNELSNINIKDIKNNILTTIGKRNKQRNLFLDDMCIKAINEWLEERKTYENLIKKAEDKNALFIGKQGCRLKKDGIGGVVKKWIENAGLPKDITPHKLRHSYCTLMYKNGVDIRSLQEIMGHSNISTTTIYTHVDDEDIKKAMMSNPLNVL